MRQIRSIADLEFVAGHCARDGAGVLTLFSGGLDSTYLLEQLARRGVRTVALAIDLGDLPDHESLREAAARFGARLVIADRRRAFADEAVAPAIRAQARYHGVYPLSASLSRPIMAAAAVETARATGCSAIVHSANLSQNSLRRLNGAIEALGFTGFYGSPYERDAVPRESKQRALLAAGLPRIAARDLSGDSNLWCREFEAGPLDDPRTLAIPPDAWRWTAETGEHGGADEVSLGFENGLACRLDGRAMSSVTLIETLNRRAGALGIGRFEGFEYLADGTKVLEVREAPAAAVLLDAARHLEMATFSAELLREKLMLEQLWVREAIEGRWFGPTRRAADAFLAEACDGLGGEVRLRLESGQVRLAGVTADAPAYLTDRDRWELEAAELASGCSLAAWHAARPMEPLSRPVDAVAVR